MSKRDLSESRLLCIDARMNEIHNSRLSEFIKESQIEELIEICEQDGFIEKANELRSDLKVK